ncbi:hypothetical protein ACFXPJ_05260, partial [Streptomyces goshikiensis]
PGGSPPPAPAPAGGPGARPGPAHVHRPQSSVAAKAQEVRIEAARADVKRAGGQICLVREDTTPFEVMRDNLDLAVDVLESRGGPAPPPPGPRSRTLLAKDMETPPNEGSNRGIVPAPTSR